MRAHLLIAGALWAVLSVFGEVILFTFSFYPKRASAEAAIVDDAFQLLMVLSAPVFAFVISVLVYSLLRFRSRGEPAEDGPPLKATRAMGGAWLAVTGALAVFVIFNPGLKGLAELRSNPRADLVVKVEGRQWLWTVSYPAQGVKVNSPKEMRLPVNKRVKFEITSVDVVHSFWVSAFRMKIDAVPGLTTSLYVTPTEVGSFSTDPGLRVQCAELCGLGHADMRMPVAVVEPAEFDAWVGSLRAQAQ